MTNTQDDLRAGLNKMNKRPNVTSDALENGPVAASRPHKKLRTHHRVSAASVDEVVKAWYREGTQVHPLSGENLGASHTNPLLPMPQDVSSSWPSPPDTPQSGLLPPHTQDRGNYYSAALGGLHPPPRQTEQPAQDPTAVSSIQLEAFWLSGAETVHPPPDIMSQDPDGASHITGVEAQPTTYVPDFVQDLAIWQDTSSIPPRPTGSAYSIPAPPTVVEDPGLLQDHGPQVDGQAVQLSMGTIINRTDDLAAENPTQTLLGLLAPLMQPFCSAADSESGGPALPTAFWSRIGQFLEEVERGIPLAMESALDDCQNLLCEALMLWGLIPVYPDTEASTPAMYGKLAYANVEVQPSPQQVRAQSYLTELAPYLTPYRGDEVNAPMLPKEFWDSVGKFVESNGHVEDTNVSPQADGTHIGTLLIIEDVVDTWNC